MWASRGPINFVIQGLNYEVADAGLAAASLRRVFRLADAAARAASARALTDVVVPPPPSTGCRRGRVTIRSGKARVRCEGGGASRARGTLPRRARVGGRVDGRQRKGDLCASHRRTAAHFGP